MWLSFLFTSFLRFFISLSLNFPFSRIFSSCTWKAVFSVLSCSLKASTSFWSLSFSRFVEMIIDSIDSFSVFPSSIHAFISALTCISFSSLLSLLPKASENPLFILVIFVSIAVMFSSSTSFLFSKSSWIFRPSLAMAHPSFWHSWSDPSCVEIIIPSLG